MICIEIKDVIINLATMVKIEKGDFHNHKNNTQNKVIHFTPVRGENFWVYFDSEAERDRCFGEISDFLRGCSVTND